MDFSIDPERPHLNTTRVGWVDEPGGRGTVSILVSCVSTLLLCTWSVMHLNIPRKNTSDAAILRTYSYWCLIGVFGPELVIWVAWRQFISAKALRDQLKQESVSHLIIQQDSADSVIDAALWMDHLLRVLRTHGRARLRLRRILPE